MDILTWYSSRIPKADQWSDQQKALQLHDATVYEKYIRDLTRCNLEHEQTARQHTSRPNQTLVILARNYAGTTEESWAYLKQMELLLSFRRLILFSICLVLSAQRDSDSDIGKLMWWVRADEKKRKSILKGTRWVHRTILTLVGRGWSMSRATELFFLVPLSNDRLVQLASKSSSGFVENIDNPDDALRKPFLTPNFTFPTLIEELCRGCSPPLVLEQICTALGYDVSLPTQHFSQVSRCTSIVQPELRIEFFTPGATVRPAADLPEDLPLRKRRKKKDAVPSLSSINTHSIRCRDPTIVEQSSASSTELADFLTLIRHLRVESFEEDLLLLGTDIQYTWDENGNQRAVDLKDSRLSGKSTTIFRDKERLSGLLRSSVDYGFLQERSEGQKRIYRVTGHSSDLLHNEDPHLDSLTFLCHICPKDEAFSQKFFATIKLLHPALTSWFRYLLERPEVLHSMPSHDNLTAACIAILRHNSSDPPNEAVLLLEHLCVREVSVHSKLAIAIAQSALLRKQLQYDGSDHVVHKALLNINCNNVHQDYLLGQLYLSLVENSILRNEHTTALEWLNNINLSTEQNRGRIPSLMWRLFEQKWTTMGRIYRFIGEFEEAKAVLEPCLEARQHLASNKLVAIARQLADVYVELGEIGSAETLLNHHLNILQEKGRQGSIPYIRLLLSYADAELRLGQFGSAKARLEEVRTWFEANSPTTPTDQLDHVRALITCMRINLHERRWSEVLEWSTAALRLADQYASFTVTNHYKGYIRKVRAISHLQLAQADMRAASECVSEPRHYMAGVGTYDRVKAREELCKALASCTSFDPNLLDVV